MRCSSHLTVTRKWASSSCSPLSLVVHVPPFFHHLDIIIQTHTLAYILTIIDCCYWHSTQIGQSLKTPGHRLKFVVHSHLRICLRSHFPSSNFFQFVLCVALLLQTYSPQPNQGYIWIHISGPPDLDVQYSDSDNLFPRKELKKPLLCTTITTGRSTVATAGQYCLIAKQQKYLFDLLGKSNAGQYFVVKSYRIELMKPPIEQIFST